MNIYIAYDTSCYTTSIAALNENGQVLASCKKMLHVQSGAKGLRQSEAVFQHLSQINYVTKELIGSIANINYNILAIGASVKPTMQENSYMPVFLVGTNFAKNFALLYNIPFYSSNHQSGHIEAAKHDTSFKANKFLAFHISGGTNEILFVDNNRINILGKTLDISFGQLLDRVGVELNLPFPAGKEMDVLASKCNSSNIIIPCSVNRNSLNCNISGAENICIKAIASYSKQEIAYSIFDFIARTMLRMIYAASNQTGITDVLVFGGVANSNTLKQIIIKRNKTYKNKINIQFGNSKFCSDNAVGIAIITKKQHEEYINE